MPHNTKAALQALLAFAIYATHDVIVKTLGAGYSPVQIVFFSTLFAFPLVTLMLIRDTGGGSLVPVHSWWVGIRTLGVVGTALCAFYAFSVLPLAQTYAILFAAPLLITLIAIPMLGEKVGLHRAAAVVVGLIGVMVVLRPSNVDLNLGHVAALMAAVMGAFVSVIVRKIGREERSVVLLIYPLLANFILLGAALPLVYQPMPIEHLLAIVLMSVLGFIAMFLIIAAYKNGEAAIVAPMQYSQIILAVIFGRLFFDETLDRETIIGAGIIIASGLYILLRESKSGSTNTPVLRTRSRLEIGGSLRIGPLIRARQRRRQEK